MGRFNYWQKFEGNMYYHIYNRGINSTVIFRKEENYKFFLRKWKSLLHPYFDILGYCLMPNHFHFLVKVKSFSSDIKEIIKNIKTTKSKKLITEKITYNEFLEDQFKRLFSSYALAFNKQENRTGSLFQKRFKRVGIDNENKLLHLLAYIHHNPIHHNFNAHFDQWQFSTYNSYINNQHSLISKTMTLLMFDNDLKKAKASFIEFHRNFKLEKETYHF